MNAFRSKTVKLLAGTAMAGAVLTGAVLPAQAAQAAPAPNAGASAEVSPGADVSLDPVAIGNAIKDAVNNEDGRSGALRAALDVGYYNDANPDRLTVAVVNKDQDINVEGDIANAENIDIKDGNYVIYWFNGPGKITNNGDGGWLNWGAQGDVNRVDEHTMSINGG
ncbi:hypothetical protein [Brachybacterium sp. NPDC056505]|uniref:hypothetical protein n=1 Tax=Brachybacterium sp. NPDC056505 TaxID=3345843 RepID=UPI00366DBC75